MMAVMTFQPFSTIGEGRLPIHMFLYINGSTVTTISGLVLGYVWLDSFKVKNTGEKY